MPRKAFAVARAGQPKRELKIYFLVGEHQQISPEKLSPAIPKMPLTEQTQSDGRERL
jgi:hypothetical protein